MKLAEKLNIEQAANSVILLVVTVDGVSSIIMLGRYRPVTANLLFVPTLLIVSVSLMNLVTAVPELYL